MGPLLSSCWNFYFFVFFGACRCLVHLVVCFFLFFGACQCFVKPESPNLHRHQKKAKNQTTRCTKPAQAPKKPKKKQISRNYGSTSEKLLDFLFFFCFFWCLPMFGASSGLFFWFYWCLPMFCEVKVTKPAQAPKKNKKINTRCTKPAQAPKKNTKNSNFQELWVHFWVVAGIFIFLFFLVPVDVWCI